MTDCEIQSWKECVANNLRKLKLKQEDAQDRAFWASGILGDHPTRASVEKRTYDDDDD